MISTPIIPNLSTIATIYDHLERVIVLQTHAILTTTDNSDLTVVPSASNALPNDRDYGSFNLGLHVNDDPWRVHAHRSQLLAAVNQQLNSAQLEQEKNKSDKSSSDDRQQDTLIHQLHWLDQIHGSRVVQLDKDSHQLTLTALQADAITTNKRGCGLAIMTADCVPIVLYQPSSGQIAAIHAGWQGLAKGIIKQTLATFIADGEILAWIGACISQDNYEVGSEVVDKLLAGYEPLSLFDHQGVSLTKDQLKSQIAVANPTMQDKYWLDLSKLTTMQLTSQGVQVCSPSQIPCSYASEHYYSYRRQTHKKRANTGRMALIIARY